LDVPDNCRATSATHDPIKEVSANANARERPGAHTFAWRQSSAVLADAARLCFNKARFLDEASDDYATTRKILSTHITADRFPIL